jgi:hypothetical protein
MALEEPKLCRCLFSQVVELDNGTVTILPHKRLQQSTVLQMSDAIHCFGNITEPNIESRMFGLCK